MDPDSIPISLLQSIPWFSDLTPEHQQCIAGFSHQCLQKKGDEIFHEGDVQDHVYVVLEGRVALEMHVPNRGRLRILTVEPFDVLGWSSLANVIRRRTVTARIVSGSAKLLAVNAKKLHRACEEDPCLGFIIMQHVANVIASRLMATRMQLLDMFANPRTEGSHG